MYLGILKIARVVTVFPVDFNDLFGTLLQIGIQDFPPNAKQPTTAFL